MRPKKLLVLIFSMAFLYFVMGLPIVQFSDAGRKADKQVINRSEILTASEIESFLTVWERFMQTETGREGLHQVSLSNGKPSDVLPRPLIRWLREQGWNANRFFYVEQRLEAIVKTALLIDNIEANKRILNRSNSPEMSINIRHIIEEQERSLIAEKVSQQEIDIVYPRLYEIEQILKGKTASPQTADEKKN